MKRTRMVCVLVGLIVCVFTASGFAAEEPTGFDKVKFGTKIEDVKKAYPQMEAPPPGNKLAALKHPKIQIFVVPKVKLADLDKPTDLTFQFWDGKFWLGQIHFGDIEQSKIDAYIEKHYGKPGYQDDNFMTWNGKTTGAVMSKRQKTFEVHDESMSNEARRELFKGRMVQGGVSVQATPSGGATTPGAAPAATPAGAPAANPAK